MWKHRDAFGASEPFGPEVSPQHTPVLVLGYPYSTVTTGVGDRHPTEPEVPHYVDALYVEDQNGDVVAAGEFSPTGEPAELRFRVPNGTTSLTPFSDCQLHGLYRGSTVAVTERSFEETACAPSSCLADTWGGFNETSSTCPLLEVMRREFERRHAAGVGAGSTTATFDPTGQAQHTPVVVIAGGKARITVGTGTISGVAADVHLQYNADDPVAAHIVEAVYATDQNGTVLAGTLISPAETPVFEFDVPLGTTAVIPYEYCNVHGLFRGESVAVGTAVTQVERNCGAPTCLGGGPPRCDLLESVRAAAVKRHSLTFGTSAPFFLPTLSPRHLPRLTISNGAATLLVGPDDNAHPMDTSSGHQIETLYATDQSGRVVMAAKLSLTEPAPTVTFAVPKGAASLTAFSLCTRHGLYQGPTVAVVDPGLRQPPCATSRCMTDPVGFGADGRCTVLQNMHNESLLRQAARPDARTAAYPPGTDPRNTPVLTLVGQRGRITVGLGTVTGNAAQVQLQANWTDADRIRVVDVIYVTDQAGTVLSGSPLSPADNPPVFEFDIPLGATSLTPYQYHNIDGLFAGESVAVPDGLVVSVEQRCAVPVCMKTGSPRCDFLESIHAENTWRHQRYWNTNAPFNQPTLSVRHQPFLTMSGRTATIVVGPAGLEHPMDPPGVHHINSIYAVDQSGWVVAAGRLGPNDDPTLSFDVPEGVSAVTAYSHCNRHGLHKGDPVAVEVSLSGGRTAPCALKKCLSDRTVGFQDDGQCPVLSILQADALRKHAERPGAPTAAYYEPNTKPVETPVLTVIGAKARITVGVGSSHLQTAGTDPAAIHVVDSVYATNQNGTVVAGTLLSLVDNPPSFEFDIPLGSTSLTPFQYCNVEGLFRGDAVDIPADLVQLVEPSCGASVCMKTGEPYCDLLQSVQADALHKQSSDHGNPSPFYRLVASPRHVPRINVTGLLAVVHAGPAELMHPMDPVSPHYVDTMFVTDQNGHVVAAGKLSPTSSEPSFQFPVPAAAASLTPFAFCNKHGLNRGDVYHVGRTVPGGSAVACSPSVCMADDAGIVSGACEMYEGTRREAERRQGGTSQYDTTNALHTPVLTLSGGRAKVTVGLGTQFAQENPLDPETIHFVEYIYVTDGIAGPVVALAVLGPLDNPPELEFDVPAAATELVPHIWDRRHGLWRGSPVVVMTAGTAAPSCEVEVCLLQGRQAVNPALVDVSTSAPTPAPTPAPLAPCTPSELSMGSIGGGGTFRCSQNVPGVDGLSLHWSLLPAGKVAFAVQSTGTGWVGMSFPDSPRLMVTAFAVIGWVSGDGPSVNSYHLTARNTAGVRVTSEAEAFIGLSESAVEEAGGVTTMRFSKDLCTSGPCLTPEQILNLNVARHPTDSFLSEHPYNHMGSVVIRLDGEGAATPPPDDTPAPGETPAPDACTPSDLPVQAGGSVMHSCMLEAGSGVTLHWTYTAGTAARRASAAQADGELQVGVRSASSGYLAVAFPQSAGNMAPAEAVYGTVSASGADVGFLSITGKSDSAVQVDAAVATSLGVLPNTTSIEEVSGDTVLRFRRRRCVGATCMSLSALGINIARHPTNDALQWHGPDQRFGVLINLDSGSGVAGVTVDYTSDRRAHGVCLMLAWVFFAPIAVFLMRYGKPVLCLSTAMTGRFTGAAFTMHACCALMTMILTIVGVSIALNRWVTWEERGKLGTAKFYHGQIGMAVFCLALVQPIIGMLISAFCPRKTHARRGWSGLIHRCIGRLLGLAGPVQCILGIANLKELADSKYGTFRDVMMCAVSFLAGLFFLGEILRRWYSVRRRGATGRGGATSPIRSNRMTVEDVREHCDDDDFYVILEGCVYDVTDWVHVHPGGPTPVLPYAGMDITEPFNAHRHSHDARNLLKHFYVCDLEEQRTAYGVQLAAEVIRHLSNFDIDAASAMVPSKPTEDVPAAMCNAMRSLLDVMEACLPFVPESIRAGNEDEDEFDEEGNPIRITVELRSPRNPPRPKQRGDSLALAFTDIVSSTMLWETNTAAMSVGLKRHNTVMRIALQDANGYEVKTVGDAFMITFDSAADACQFALQAMEELVLQDWPEALLDIPLCKIETSEIVNSDGEKQEVRHWGGIKVRIGIHTGPVEVEVNPVTRRSDYFGPTVNVAARTEAESTPGVIAITTATRTAIEESLRTQLNDPIVFDLGLRGMKGCREKQQLYGLIPRKLSGREAYAVQHAREKTLAQDAPPQVTPQFGKHDSMTAASKLSTDSAPRKTMLARRLQGAGAEGHKQGMHEVPCTILAARLSLGVNSELREALDAFVAAAEEAVMVGHGILHSVFGHCLLATFNVARPARGHIQRACRTAGQLYKALHGEAHLCSRDGVFGGPGLCIGVCTGDAIHGTAGGKKTRFSFLVGECVDVATMLPWMCERDGTLGLLADVRTGAGPPRFSRVLMRPMDYVKTNLGKILWCYELYLPELAKMTGTDQSVLSGYGSENTAVSAWEMNPCMECGRWGDKMAVDLLERMIAVLSSSEDPKSIQSIRDRMQAEAAERPGDCSFQLATRRAHSGAVGFDLWSSPFIPPPPDEGLKPRAADDTRSFDARSAPNAESPPPNALHPEITSEGSDVLRRITLTSDSAKAELPGTLAADSKA